MCLIIARTTKGHTDWKLADYAASRNRHGYGVAWPRPDGRVGLWTNMDWAPIRRKALALEEAGFPFVLHMRYATNGAKVKANCHPFRIAGHNMVMAHNGVLRTIAVPPRMSDSRVLATRLSYLPHGFLEDAATWEKVERLADDSRLAFLTGAGELFLVNEEAGAWRDGCWYSQAHLFAPPTKRKNGEDPWNPTTWRVRRKRDSVPAVSDILDEMEIDLDRRGTPKTYDPDAWRQDYHQRRAAKVAPQNQPKQQRLSFGYHYSGLGPDGLGRRK